MLALGACGISSNVVSKDLPPAPVTLGATKAALQKNTYTVEDVGFIRTFMGKEDPVEWSGAREDTVKMYREFIDDRKKLQLEFLTDTSLILTGEKTKYNALYSLEKDTSSVVLLDIKYADPDFAFAGSSETSMVTFTYKIRGISDKQLYLQTPNSYNDQPAVVLMRKK